MDVMYKVTEADPPPWPSEYSADLAALFKRLFLSHIVFVLIIVNKLEVSDGDSSFWTWSR